MRRKRGDRARSAPLMIGPGGKPNGAIVCTVHAEVELLIAYDEKNPLLCRFLCSRSSTRIAGRACDAIDPRLAAALGGLRVSTSQVWHRPDHDRSDVYGIRTD